MKYYYNGKLVRTSKRTYTHGVINERGGCFACSSSKELAEAVIKTAINQKLAQIKNSDTKIAAMKAGKKTWTCIEGRRTYHLPIDREDSVEKSEEWKAFCREQIENIKKWKVVELEAR